MSEPSEMSSIPPAPRGSTGHHSCPVCTSGGSFTVVTGGLVTAVIVVAVAVVDVFVVCPISVEVEVTVVVPVETVVVAGVISFCL